MSITLPDPHDSESIAIDAVEYCVLAWNDALEKQCAKGKDEYSAIRYAHKAFRQALPDLTSPAKIQGFIACVSRGVLIGAIDHADASRLLYAAQVARQSVNAGTKPARESQTRKPVQAESGAESGRAIA